MFGKSDAESDSLYVYTFLDSQTWGLFYGYNQVIIIITILISSYSLARNVQLDYQCHKFLKNIYLIFANICIAINGLKKHYKYKNDFKNIKSYEKVKNITIEMVMNVIDVKCDEMHALVDNIRQYFQNQVL